jgi:hypothetical protein
MQNVQVFLVFKAHPVDDQPLDAEVDSELEQFSECLLCCEVSARRRSSSAAVSWGSRAQRTTLGGSSPCSTR